MVDCGQGSRVYTVTECLGGVKFKFEGLLPVAPDVLRDLASEMNLGIQVTEEVVAGRQALVLHGASIALIRKRLCPDRVDPEAAGIVLLTGAMHNVIS
jgi:hypothetical protein